MARYDHKKIEEKWRKKWLKEKIYEPDFRRAQKPFYNLMMFPYPSAEGLHIGGMRTFTGVDIYGRMKRMQGHDVFEPIGLDGFGIHSENYALKIGKHPIQHAKDSEKNFYRQLAVMGNGFAWDERLETYDPEYYKWTQWIFVQMFKRGLAYRKKAAVNWCPSCKTVLADEQVIVGKCERCSSDVFKKDLEQWFFKITDYAERLLKNLDKINWDERIKIAQRNWIGRSEGAEIEFSLAVSGLNGEVIFATNNQGKVKRMQKLIKAAGLSIILKTPTEIGINNFDVIEDRNTLSGNAEKKARVLAEKTSLPVLADDAGFFINGAMIDPITVKRNALAGVDEKSLSIEEVAKRMQKFYEEIASSFGGKVDAEWRNALCLVTSEKIVFHAESIRPVILTNKSHGKVDPYLPLRGLYVSKATGKYVLEQTDEEEIQELQPVIDAVKKLFIPVLKIFTTRPDTLFGATYMVLGPEHVLLRELRTKNLELSNWKEVEDYIKKAKTKTEEERIAEGKEKTGVELMGIKAINPANNEEIPVWVADYVLGNIGTGAIMAVPAHDDRDYEFAKKFNLPIRSVIEPVFFQTTEPGKVVEGLPFDNRDAIIAIVEHWSEEKYIGLKWKEVVWGTLITGGIEKGQTAEDAAIMEIREETGFLHPKLVRDFGMVHGKFYHVPKKTNRFAHARVLYFKLQDGVREDITAEEKAKHEVSWYARHDLRKFLTPDTHQRALDMLNGVLVYTGQGILGNSGTFSGMDSERAKWEITRFVGGQKKINYRLRDWLISRQRYWGPPIPMIYCETCARSGTGEFSKNGRYQCNECCLFYADKSTAQKCQAWCAKNKSCNLDIIKYALEDIKTEKMAGWYAVPEKDLPVRLPYIKEFRPTGTDKSPLATFEKFYKVRCPKCKAWARRETDVSDSFLDSAWYYIGYLMAFGNWKLKIGNSAFAKLTRRWLPVHSYIGGAEHSVLHLLYARFVAMAFHDWGMLSFEEPFANFRAHGLITKNGAKMSKSKGNVVNPDEYIKVYGTDVMRMYLAFLAPLIQDGDFRDEGIRGITRFLERTRKLILNFKFSILNKISNVEIQKTLHKTIKKATEDIEALQYNTAISALMTFLNAFEKNPNSVSREDIKVFLKLLAPFAPHLTEELWSGFTKSKKYKSIHLEKWPEYNPALIQEETFELVIQINGKVRDKFTAKKDISKEEATRLTLMRKKVKLALGTHEPKGIIFVPGRLINIVI